MQRKTIVVLGMHRSGTSAVARMLSLLGCDLPNTLMPEAPSNPKGHWESNAIMALNDAVLHSAGSSWDDWQEYNPAWYDSPVVDDFLQRASTVLHEEFGTSPLFVLKDPRNCRLTRFWFDVLDRADVSPLVVIPLRNPLEVVDSLEKRDGMHRDLAMLLWLRHVLDAEHGSRKRRRVFLTYENLLDDWVGVPERMQDTLGITWPRFSSLTAMNMEAFLDRSSRHHVRSEKSVRSNLTVSKWVRDTDTILRRWAMSEENPDDYAALDDIRQQLNVAGPAFAKLTYDVSSERHQNLELRALLQAREGELAQLKNEFIQLRDSKIASDEQGSKNIQAAEAKLENTRLELEAERSKLESDLASLREHAETVEADLRATLADKELGAAALDAAQGDMERLREELSNHRHNLADVQSTLRQREEEIVQTLASLDDKHQQLAEAEAGRIKAEGRLEAAEAKLENTRLELEAERSKLESDLASLREHAETVEADLRATLADKELGAAALDAAQGDMERLREELSNHRHNLADVQSTLRQREEEIVQTLASLDDKHQQLAEAEAGRIKAEGRLEAAEAKLQDANAWVFRLAGERKKSEDRVAVIQSRLAATEKTLSFASARLADVQSHYLSPEEKSTLLNKIEQLNTLAEDFRIQKEEAKQGLKAAQSEVVALSKLLQQRQAELDDGASVKAQMEMRENELTALAEDFRIQKEEAKQGLKAAQSEVVALSKLLQQRQAELDDGASVKAQMEMRENELTALAEDFRIQKEEAKQGLKAAQSEVVALSKLLQQRQAELDDGASVKAQMEMRENELTALAEDFRIQKEEAKQGLKAAQSEVVALSKLLQQRQAELTDMRPLKEVMHLSTQLKSKEEAADWNSRHAEWLQEVNTVVTGYPHWWAFAPKNMREKWQNGRLLRKGLFDADSYLARYPDVLSSGINPLRHYIIHGIKEKRTF